MLIKRFFNQRFSGLSKISISKQIPLLLGGTLVISLLFAGMLATSEITKTAHQQADKLGNALAEQTANSARDLLVTGDRLSLNVMLGQLTRSEYIARATIFSIDNQRIASTESSDFNTDKQYALYSASIDYQNVIAGQLRLEVDMERFEQPTHKALFLFVGLALLLGITGTVIAWNYGRSKSEMLSRTVRQLQGISHGERAYSADIKDEVQQLSSQMEYLITSGYQPEQKLQNLQPELTGNAPSRPDFENPIILAIRFSNMARLHNSLNQPALLKLIEERLPLINDAAQLYNGKLEYSAEGNAYIRFARESSTEAGIQEAICCARLVQNLITIQQEGDPAALTLELGISTLTPTTPEAKHPSLADSATSLALMLASLGRGKLLLDGQDADKAESGLKASLLDTEFGEDIAEVGALPEQFNLLIERQAEQIRLSTS
ncbi:hypothetical protein [Parendozoicomonas sp. Alg238-R29]|uniref:hypothetical protein n=1 Tax=Parendozoicomonas sp. Alg238-R29 TaxID=2993446 RepID=UPI00248ED33B|nr:hypothetical protein [Parendozoicomonas sp. Alg238-R29]